jgi:hypothetical protein
MGSKTERFKCPRCGALNTPEMQLEKHRGSLGYMMYRATPGKDGLYGDEHMRLVAWCSGCQMTHHDGRYFA